MTSPSTARRLKWLREFRDLPAQFFEEAHIGRVCVRVFIEVSVRASWVSVLYYVIFFKKRLRIFQFCFSRGWNSVLARLEYVPNLLSLRPSGIPAFLPTPVFLVSVTPLSYHVHFFVFLLVSLQSGFRWTSPYVRIQFFFSVLLAVNDIFSLFLFFSRVCPIFSFKHKK